MIKQHVNTKEQELLQIEINMQRIIPISAEQFKKDEEEKKKIKEMKKLLKKK